MIIIADSGSTKTDWRCIVDDGSISSFTTQGINPYMLKEEDITYILRNEFVVPTSEAGVTKLFFYGAGCTEEKRPMMTKLISEALNCEEVEVQSDLLGAARALYGKNKGIACILGTGSNSCLYDGQTIKNNIPPLGFILGDEGSGAVLGRNLVGDILKGQMPEKLVKSFFEYTGLCQSEILNRVYKQTFPNRFLASLTHFLAAFKEEEAIKTFIVHNFRRFFTRNVKLYDRPELMVSFVGSVAYHFCDELKEAAQKEDFTIGKILKSPIEGLIEHHLQPS